MVHYDVIVLGGGTMGSATAWTLGKRGARTLVLEQFAHVHGFGSHGGKTRIIRHAYQEGADYVPLVRRADALWQGLEAESGERILHRTGGLDLAAPGYGDARRARASAEAFDLPFEWLSGAEVNRRWPAWHLPADWEACFSPDGGFLATEPALRALAAGSRQRGVAIHEGEPVRDWGAEGAGGVRVRTDRATYHADRLIVTAGAWASQVLADLALPLEVRRKVLWWFSVEEPTAYAPERFPIFVSESGHGAVYGFPIADSDGFKIAQHAGGAPTTPEIVDRTARDAEQEEVLPFARRYLRGVTDRALASAVCLYTVTPDQDFVMDRHPEWPQVVIGAGFSGHGFKFATAVGEHLAALALDAGAAPYPRFGVDRLRSPTAMAW